MEIIPQLISRYSIVLYALCGIACVYFFVTGVASLRELRRAVFRLERKAVVSRAISALLKAALCIVIGAGIYGVTTMVPVSKASALAGSATSTPAGIIIPTSMPTAVIVPGQATSGQAITTSASISDASRALTTTGTVSTTTQVSDCSNPNAQIISPWQGEKVSGTVAVKGTAVLTKGDWYRLEIQVPGTSTWTQVGRGDATVISGVLLGTFGSAAYTPGIYPFRLQIVGSDGAVRANCRMPMTIGK